MSTTRIDLQKSFFDLLSEKKLDDAVEIFDSEASFFFPNVPETRGKRAIRRLLGMINSRFSQIQWKTEPEIYGEPDVVVSRWKVWGKFKSGKEYRNEGVSVLRLNEAGKIFYFKDHFVSTDFSET